MKKNINYDLKLKTIFFIIHIKHTLNISKIAVTNEHVCVLNVV